VTRHPTEIVVTSDRLHDVTVYATHTIRLLSNGDVVYTMDWYNSGSSRKFFKGVASVTSESTNITETFYVNCGRVDRNAHGGAAPITRKNPTLAARWNDVLGGSIAYDFRLSAFRLDRGC
jgi:hypothetical protein